MTQNGLLLSVPRKADAAVPGPYDVLCGHARSLGRDAAFRASLRTLPRLEPNTLLRCALEALPDLELLPLPVLAAELLTALEWTGVPPVSWPGCGWTSAPP